MALDRSTTVVHRSRRRRVEHPSGHGDVGAVGKLLAVERRAERRRQVHDRLRSGEQRLEVVDGEVGDRAPTPRAAGSRAATSSATTCSTAGSAASQAAHPSAQRARRARHDDRSHRPIVLCPDGSGPFRCRGSGDRARQRVTWVPAGVSSSPGAYPVEVSADGPGSSDNPFEGMPFLGDLMRMIGQQGAVSWDGARQLALSIATGGESEPNVDPMARISFEQLARVAEIHVANATGLPTSVTGRSVTVTPVTRSQWALATIDAYRPLFERMAGAIKAENAAAAPGSDIDHCRPWARTPTRPGSGSRSSCSSSAR